MSVCFFECLWVCLECEDGSASETSVGQDRHEFILGEDAPDLVILDQHNVKTVLVHFKGFSDELFKVVDLFVAFD